MTFARWRRQMERDYPGVTIISEERGGVVVGAIGVLDQKTVGRWPV